MDTRDGTVAPALPDLVRPYHDLRRRARSGRARSNDLMGEFNDVAKQGSVGSYGYRRSGD
ncbi:hypothetical protein [Microvirga aerophila]|uniref:hypothetical protein n=1 Tax=Microvirga aerophila TaxID=670291 RepID=UPI001479585E|nr:hypothetical protein [Microvirga aerophila]